MYLIRYTEDGTEHEAGAYLSLAAAVDAAIRRGFGNNSPELLSFVKTAPEGKKGKKRR